MIQLTGGPSDGQCVEIDDADDRLSCIELVDPVRYRTDKVAEVKLPSGLNARKHPRHSRESTSRLRKFPRCNLGSFSGIVLAMAIQVETPVFAGPFDLLLHLILREQVDLYEVSLVTIVDEYLAVLEQMEALDLNLTTEFLLIAATLVELKARRLVPGLDDGDLDEELGLWEERDLLLARLLECKTFKDASLVLASLHQAASRCYPRVNGPDERYVDLTPDALAGITPQKLHNAYVQAHQPKPKPSVDLFHVAPIRASVVDAIEELLDELPRSGRLSFRSLTEAFVERLDIIVRFLAVLELFKQGIVDLHQAERFGDIDIRWVAGGTVPEIGEVLADSYEG